MIEEFSFGNFFSFKEMQTLNLTAEKIKAKKPELDTDNLIFVNKDLQLLKTKAIYGANASGKSNVLQALLFFIDITRNSVRQEVSLKLIESFKLSTETENEPTFFQMVFRLGDIRYRYGFEADERSIKSEWLFSNVKKENNPYLLEKGKSY